MLKALKEVEGWAEAKAQSQDAELQDLERAYAHFRGLERTGRTWTGNVISGAVWQPPKGPESFGLLNFTANELGQEIENLKKSISAVSQIGNEALKLRQAIESPQARRLPIVSWETAMRGFGVPGKQSYPATAKKYLEKGDYYLDERLKELRLVSNPNVVVRLNEFEVEYFKQRAR
jgi:hypothetical protein